MLLHILILASHLITCITYLNTLTRLYILIHASPILIHWVGFRFSAPYLNTLNWHKSSRQPSRFEHPRTLGSRQPIKIKHPRLSAANQNRILRHPSRQPIKIEHYVTESSRLGLKTLLGSRLESARHSLS